MRSPKHKINVVKLVTRLVRKRVNCPNCHSLYCYFRTRTCDYVCRRCGQVFDDKGNARGAK